MRSPPPCSCSARVRAPPWDGQVGVAACAAWACVGPNLDRLTPPRRPIPPALPVVTRAVAAVALPRATLVSFLFVFLCLRLRLACEPSSRGLPCGGLDISCPGAACPPAFPSIGGLRRVCSAWLAGPEVQERECCRLSTAAFPCGAITLPDAAVTPGVRWDLISVAKTFGASSCCFPVEASPASFRHSRLARSVSAAAGVLLVLKRILGGEGGGAPLGKGLGLPHRL